MKRKCALVFLLSVCVVSLKGSNNLKYCLVRGNSSGLFIADPINGKDSTFSGKLHSSRFRDNTTEPISLMNILSDKWKKIQSVENGSKIKQPVIDKRWEEFPTSHDSSVADWQTKLSNSQNHSIFMSARIYEINSTFSKTKWYHFMAKNKTLYHCNDDFTCEEDLGIDYNKSLSDYFNHLWKLHEYDYFYTDSKEPVSEQIYANCTTFQNGCIHMFLAMCKNCSLHFQINNTKSKTFKGNGLWQTVAISLSNFSQCWNISVATDSSQSDENRFWAMGDKMYFSTNSNCEQNKRYIDFTNLNSSLYCEHSTNENITLRDELYGEEIKETKPTMSPKSINKEEKEEPPVDKSSSGLLAVFIVVPIVLIIGLGLMIYFLVLRKSKNDVVLRGPSLRYDQNNETVELLSSPEEQPILLRTTWDPVKQNDFVSYVHLLFDPERKKDYLKEQFSNIRSGYLKSANEGRREENVRKNRFSKILPYDENRVKLEKNLDDKGNLSDYINASYVQGFNDPKEYIVTQNPIVKYEVNTVPDFWRMIWQEKIEYIVMISGTDEEYHKYWPELKEKITFDNININVSVNRIEHYEFFNRREFSIRRYGETRQIHQLHFHAWNEMLSPHIFLEFVNHLLKIPHTNVPVLFHCMAGIGRSGTILLCDIALRTVAITGSFNLSEITKSMRKCRTDMVSNLKQYQLAHLIIMESLSYKDLSIEINADYEAHFSRLFEGNIMKKMWSEHLENKERIYGALTPYVYCRQHPNRNRYDDPNLLPVEHSRVALQYKKPDYIHAMWVIDYKQKKNMIVAQQPMNNTLNDFWIMILQNQVKTIINLNELDPRNPGDCIFYPSLEKPHMKIHQNVGVLQIVSEENNLSYDKLNLTVKLTGNQENTVSVINVRGWHKIKSIPESTDVLISIWEAAKKEKINNFPILICCDDGIRSSGLVACFFYMADKMLYERKCDVVGAVTAVRRTHNNFINFEQFVFLNHFALAFYKNCFKKLLRNNTL